MQINNVNQNTLNLRGFYGDNMRNKYFYENNISFIDHNLKTVDITKLRYNCEIGCEMCEKDNSHNCKKCKYGFFMYFEKCYTICPKEFVADIYTRSCNVLDNTSNICPF